jgi:hypothetical protein
VSQSRNWTRFHKFYKDSGTPRHVTPGSVGPTDFLARIVGPHRWWLRAGLICAGDEPVFSTHDKKNFSTHDKKNFCSPNFTEV